MLRTVVINRSTHQIVREFIGPSLSWQDDEKELRKVLSEGRYNPSVSSTGRYVAFWNESAELQLYDLKKERAFPLSVNSAEFFKKVDRLQLGFSPSDDYFVVAISDANKDIGGRVIVLELPPGD